MIKRIAAKELLNLSRQYKAIAVIGPRQSGKTTLVKNCFPEKEYINLENPDVRNFALEDPRAFLKQYEAKGAILDEAQRVPELFSYLQEILDKKETNTPFIITGSNNFLLQQNISQSLAGRIGYLTLLPFSISEIRPQLSKNLNSVLLKGFYPPLFDTPFEVSKWYVNYIKTYVERDVRLLKNIDNFVIFERFLRLCAGRIGQILNKNSLSVEVGVSNKTIESWISVLEASFIVFRLKPHHTNFNKRVVKMPKLYFYDVGLACALLGIKNEGQLDLHPFKGALFENLVVMELLKERFNKGEENNLYFWRNNAGNEIDIIIDNFNELYPIEIKSGQTVQNNYFKGLKYWESLTGVTGGKVIYAGDKAQKRSDGKELLPFYAINEIIA